MKEYKEFTDQELQKEADECCDRGDMTRLCIIVREQVKRLILLDCGEIVEAYLTAKAKGYNEQQACFIASRIDRAEFKVRKGLQYLREQMYEELHKLTPEDIMLVNTLMKILKYINENS